MKINREIKNPYLLSYLSFALICVLSLGLVFLLISTKISQEEQLIRDEAKLEMISENVHQQLAVMRKVEMEITGNTVYYPKFFSESKYYEVEVLKNFEQYLSRLSMADEILLYYGDRRIFRGSGTISDFDVYFQEQSGIEKEEIRSWLDSSSWEGFSFLKTKNIYIGLPLNRISNYGAYTAKLCFEIKEDTFAEYLDMLGGIRNGKFALYHGELCLYSNTDEKLYPDTEEKDKSVITDDTYDLTFVFISDNIFALGGNYVILSILLIFAIAIWIVMIAYLFAGKAYKPIKKFVDTYKERIGYEEYRVSGNELEEMGDAIENLLVQHQEVREQLNIEETKLKEVFLRALLKGDHAESISKYMEYVQINLKGNYFFVCSVLLEEQMLEAEFTNSSRSIFESRIRELVKMDAIYVLSRTNPRDMSIICCIWEREEKELVMDAIRKAAEEFCSKSFIDCGETYDQLKKLSASYLESLDRINRLREQRNRNSQLQYGTELDSKSTLQFFVYLRAGEESEALNELHLVIEEFEQKNMSFLFQQYILAEFMHHISKTAKECYIEISPKLLSLMISAKTLKEFGEAVELVVRQFCEELRAKERESDLNQSREIIEYIGQHFTEYDISIEGVARILDVKTSDVRNSVMQHFGKSYKEYVLSLRMEEAKRLLTEKCLSIDETSRRLGYANASYFIKLFKKTYGITPADYKSINGVSKS